MFQFTRKKYVQIQIRKIYIYLELYYFKLIWQNGKFKKQSDSLSFLDRGISSVEATAFAFTYYHRGISFPDVTRIVFFYSSRVSRRGPFNPRTL